MPKRKGVKKNLDNGANSQEENFPSFSAFSMRLRSRTNQSQQTKNQTSVKKPPGKKRKIVSSSNSVKECDLEAGQGQASEVKEVLLNDLPPEMLIEVLKCVDTRTLFACRQVNQKWNGISCDILHHRPEAQLSFTFCNGNFLIKGSDKEIKNPCDFLKLFKQSKNCPIARFHFRDVTSSSSAVLTNFWDSTDFNKFLAHFALDSSTSTSTSKRAHSTIKIKCLKFDFCFAQRKDYTDSFAIINEELRDLLLRKIPYLQEFGLTFSDRQFSEPQVRFFPVAANQSTYKNPVPVQFQLLHLKAIYFEHDMFTRFPGIYKDLVNAAVNLKVIHFEHDNSVTTEEFHFWISMRKPYLVKNRSIIIYDDFFSALKQQQKHEHGDSPVSLLKFEKMEVNMDEIDPDSASAIQNLCESNKNTLLKLALWPLGTCHRIELPIFRNVRRLTLNQDTHCLDQRSSNQMFPAGVRSVNIFPLVNSLDFSPLDWSCAFPQEDSIPILPCVETLNLSPGPCGCERGCACREKSIRVASLMCPNLKHLNIDIVSCQYGQASELLPVARAIWTHMRQLESLEIEVNLGLPANNSTALDSAFTGISLEECQHLAEVMEAKNTLEKWKSRAKIPPSELTAKREYPSILDMKDLKKLTINSYSGSRRLGRKEIYNKLTWISEEFAFKLMPHLKQE